MTATSRLTSEQRAVAVAVARSNPAVMARLAAAVDQMVEGGTYAVEAFKNGRRSTVEGTLVSRSADEITVDGGGRKRRVLISDITRITCPKEQE